MLCPVIGSLGKRWGQRLKQNLVHAFGTVSNKAQLERLMSSSSNSNYIASLPYEDDKVAVVMKLHHEPGSLQKVLSSFSSLGINLTSIESRPSAKDDSGFDVYIAFEQRQRSEVENLLAMLNQQTNQVLLLDGQQTPWFPRHIEQLDLIANRTLAAGEAAELQSDHPGFHDPAYRRRREELAALALGHTHGDALPEISYTEEEHATWRAVWGRLEGSHQQFACEEYLGILRGLAAAGVYGPEGIPRAGPVSEYLQAATGFRLRPVAGLLSSRDFLNALAFRTFCATQYIRHHSVPLYTPEPDICHELIGHAPMFADPDFADFSQEIGLASLGASEEDIQKLARCYWFSVEFGLCKTHKDSGKVKAFGAGLLSSFGELEYACSPSHGSKSDARPGGGERRGGVGTGAAAAAATVAAAPELRPWDPAAAAEQGFPISEYQPVYYVAESLADAKEKMRSYCQNMKRPFYARYNPVTESIWVDRPVRMYPKDKEHQKAA